MLHFTPSTPAVSTLTLISLFSQITLLQKKPILLVSIKQSRKDLLIELLGKQ